MPSHLLRPAISHSIVTILFLVSSIWSLGLAQSPAKKPPVGVPTDATLFNGKWYYVYIQKTSWKASKGKCERLGGQLAVVHDEATWAFIKTLSPGVNLWLGASDDNIEGSWVWVDGKPMTFKVWDRDQPDNFRQGEHYLLRWDGKWNDVSEKGSGVHVQVQGFICEWIDK
jgi:hypothetical protein